MHEKIDLIVNPLCSLRPQQVRKRLEDKASFFLEWLLEVGSPGSEGQSFSPVTLFWASPNSIFTLIGAYT